MPREFPPPAVNRKYTPANTTATTMMEAMIFFQTMTIPTQVKVRFLKIGLSRNNCHTLVRLEVTESHATGVV